MIIKDMKTLTEEELTIYLHETVESMKGDTELKAKLYKTIPGIVRAIKKSRLKDKM